MTDRLDAAKGPDVVSRWRDLAEQRLEYLTDLFESGRWRRYYSERAFLENIQEAKAAVGAWRDLSKTGAADIESAIEQARLVARAHTAAVVREEAAREQAAPSEPQPLQLEIPIQPEMPAKPPEPAFATEPSAMSVVLQALEQSLREPSRAAVDVSAIELRYPALRNTL